MFEYIVNWITDNGPLLSGLAALIAIVGVFVSPIGRGIRHVARRLASSSTENSDHETAAPTVRHRPSVAVMPFKNTSGDADQDYLADGLTEDIITTLSYGPSFDVIARNSTFAFKGQAADIRGVGAHLGATYVVEGSMRTLGDNVRVTVQVNDADTGAQIWAEKFDRPMSAFLDIQDDVVEAIACQIVPEIERMEYARDKHLATEDLGAWALVRRASVIFEGERNTRDNLNRVIEYAQKAIDLDPNYPEAYGLLSRAYAVAVVLNETDNKERDLQAAADAFQKMRSLAPNNADTFYTQGQLALATDQLETALTAFKNAYDRNPNNVRILSVLGLTASRLGYAQDGIDLIERALELSPRDPARHMHHFALANAAMSIGDTQKALAHAKKSVDLFDEFPGSLATYAAVLHELGREDEARAQIDRMRTVSPGTTRQELIRGAERLAGLEDQQAERYDAFLRAAGVQ